MSAKREIPPRPGIEVFLNQGDTISIKQIDHFGEESIVVVHPDDVPRLIRFLEEVQQEAYANYDEDDSDSIAENVGDSSPTGATSLRLVEARTEDTTTD